MLEIILTRRIHILRVRIRRANKINHRRTRRRQETSCKFGGRDFLEEKEVLREGRYCTRLDGAQMSNGSATGGNMVVLRSLLVRVPKKLYEESPEPLLQLISRYLVFVKPPSLIKIVTEDQSLIIEGRILQSLVEGANRLRFEMERTYPTLLKQKVPLFLSFLKDFEILKEVEITPNDNKPLRAQRRYSLGHLSIGLTNYIYMVSYQNFLMKMLVLELSYILRHYLKPSLLSKGKANDFIEYRTRLAKSLLEEVEPSLSAESLDLVPIHSTFRSMGLSKFFPPLADSKVDEFYVDGPGELMYLDHSESGRLGSNIKVKREDIEALVTLMRRESGLRLDFSSPSLKANLNSRLCLARVSIDTQPLALNYYVVDVKKLRAEPYTILDLLNLGSLNIEAACLLILCLYHRNNITIVGEPGSGKTTLLNALDLCTPRWWRKLYIEDTQEVQDVPWQHQTRFLVDPYGTTAKSRGTKTSEITKTLHRNPSYVILGEVQSYEQVKALFHACASGIRVMHTVHSRDLEHFLGRLLHVYEIKAELLKYLDILVECFKLETPSKTIRIVRKISEIIFEDGCPRLRELIIFDPHSGKHSCQFDIERTSVFRKISHHSMVEIDAVYGQFLELKELVSNVTSNTSNANLSWRLLYDLLHPLYEKWSSGGLKIEGIIIR
jgi:pilus assembly protein CpaF